MLWYNILAIDFFQSLLLANNHMFKGLRLLRVLRIVKDELGLAEIRSKYYVILSIRYLAY